MSLREALDTALDKAIEDDRSGAVEATSEDGGKATVDVVQVDKLGVRVKGVVVTRNRAVPVEQFASELPDRLRTFPDRVAPVEVDSELDGAIFRTPLSERERDYFQIDVRGRESEVKRFAVNEQGERSAEEFTLTREGLGRMVDDLS